jgi:hypothetical protein
MPKKSRQQWEEEHYRALAVLEDVRRDLLGIPGVVGVGIGVKEIGGRQTEDISFRVVVAEKLPESALPRAQLIPRTIHGFKTDVMILRPGLPEVGFNDELDGSNYRTKVGGCRIAVEDHDADWGTLGCFVRSTVDGSTMVLSAAHVLMIKGANVGVGQPAHSKSCCCACNEIAKTVASPADLGDADVAVARLKSGVRFSPKIRRIKRPDGTLELSGAITGHAEPITMHEVWKVGATTGLTRGQLGTVFPGSDLPLLIGPIDPFLDWSEPGDSGAAVVDLATGGVVGIHVAGDPLLAEWGRATPIQLARSRLKIEIIPTPADTPIEAAAAEEETLAVSGPPEPERVLAYLADRLRVSESGRYVVEMFHRHREECTALVNHCRPVTVAWHRIQGPTWVAALMRSVREPGYRLPDSLEGVSRADALRRLRQAFTTHGSAALRDDIGRHADAVMPAALGAESVDAWLAAWEPHGAGSR